MGMPAVGVAGRLMSTTGVPGVILGTNKEISTYLAIKEVIQLRSEGEESSQIPWAGSV